MLRKYCNTTQRMFLVNIIWEYLYWKLSGKILNRPCHVSSQNILMYLSPVSRNSISFVIWWLCFWRSFITELSLVTCINKCTEPISVAEDLNWIQSRHITVLPLSRNTSNQGLGHNNIAKPPAWFQRDHEKLRAWETEILEWEAVKTGLDGVGAEVDSSWFCSHLSQEESRASTRLSNLSTSTL